MKKLLVGLLALGSISAFARDFYSQKAKLYLTHNSIEGSNRVSQAKGILKFSDAGGYCYLRVSDKDYKCYLRGDFYTGVDSRIFLRNNEILKLAQDLGLPRNATLAEQGESDGYQQISDNLRTQYHTDKITESYHLYIKPRRMKRIR